MFYLYIYIYIYVCVLKCSGVHRYHGHVRNRKMQKREAEKTIREIWCVSYIYIYIY